MEKPNILDFIQEKILRETFTKPELARRIRILKDFLSFLMFEQKADLKVPLQKRIEDYLALRQISAPYDSGGFREREWLLSLGDDFYNQITPDVFSKMFGRLEKNLESIKTLILYCAVEIPEKQQERIGQWLKQNISPSLIFESNLDPNLIGGAALSFNGIYKDFSLRVKILDSHQAILENLRAFKKDI